MGRGEDRGRGSRSEEEGRGGWRRTGRLFPVLPRSEKTRKTDEEAATRRKEGGRGRKRKRRENGLRVVELERGRRTIAG